jgi:Na+-transporting methylmalonyl-CoA/oxaloacetate decarboxylase gamma subunit
MGEAIELTLMVYGLSIVVAMLAAVLIKVLVAILSINVSSAEKPAAAPAKNAATDIPPDHLLAIAAAVHQLMRGSRIVSIEPGAGAAGRSPAA